MITMGQLRKLLNVTLDNIQLSGNKLHKFLISDSGQEPMTKVIMEFGPSVAESGLHSAVTINLLEMTLECIEDSGGQLLTFLIEDNDDNVMKVILEFQPKGFVKSTPRKLCASCVPNQGGHGTFPLGSQRDHYKQAKINEPTTSNGQYNNSQQQHRRHSIGSTSSVVDSEICTNNDTDNVARKRRNGVTSTTVNPESLNSPIYSTISSESSDDKCAVPLRKNSARVCNESVDKKEKSVITNRVPSELVNQESPINLPAGQKIDMVDQTTTKRDNLLQYINNSTNSSTIIKDPFSHNVSTNKVTTNVSNTNSDDCIVSYDNNNTLKQRPLAFKLPTDFQAPLVHFKGGDIKPSGAKSPPLAPTSTVIDSSKTNGAIPKHIGNGKINNNNKESPILDDLKREAQDEVLPLPSIEKSKSQNGPRRRSSSPAAPRSSPSTSKQESSDAEDDDYDEDRDDDSDDSIELISDIKTSKPTRKKGVLVRRSTMFF